MAPQRATRVWFVTVTAIVSAICAVAAPGQKRAAAGADKSGVVRHFRAGQQAIKSGEVDLAVKEYKTVLRLDPGLVEAQVNLGLAYHMLREYDLAAAELAKALHQRPNLLGPNIILGIDYLKLGLPDEAMPPLKHVIAIAPSNYLARRTLASSYEAKGDYLSAEREFQKAFSLEPDKAEAGYGLGHVFLDMSSQLTTRLALKFPNSAWRHRLAGDFLAQRHLWNDAAREYREALTVERTQDGLLSSLGSALIYGGKIGDAEAEFKSELRLDPHSVEALLGLAKVRVGQGDATGALREVSRALQISPGLLPDQSDFPLSGLTPVAWLNLISQWQESRDKPAASFLLWSAYRYLGERGKAEEQRKTFESLTEGLRSEEPGREARGSVHQACESDDFAACAKGLDSRKNLRPADYLVLGKSQLALGHLDAAADAFAVAFAELHNAEATYWLARTFTAISEACFTKLLTKFPGSWRTHELKADIDQLEHDNKNAVSEYKSAILLQPDKAVLHRGLGALYLSTHSLEDADRELKKALLLNPNNSSGLYLMGRLCLAQGNPQSAVRYLKRALQYDPSLLDARATLGKAYLRLGQAALAVPELEKALVLDRYGDLHYLLYQAYRELGNKDLAQKALTQSGQLSRKSEANDQAMMNQAAAH